MAENWFNTPIKVIDRTKVVTQHFLEIFFKKSKIKIEKSKTHKKVFVECLLCLVVLCVLCYSVCLFVYVPFCHGALNLDLSTWFTTFFLTSF